MKDLVLAVGLQRGYFDPQGTQYLGGHAATFLVNVMSVIQSLDNIKYTVKVVSNVRGMEDNLFRGLPSANYVGSPDILLMPGVSTMADTRMQFSRHSLLEKTQLEPELKKSPPGCIYLVGVETHAAILFTAHDLRRKGYNVRVPEPLVMSRDPYLHNAAITILSMELGIDVIKSI